MESCLIFIIVILSIPSIHPSIPFPLRIWVTEAIGFTKLPSFPLPSPALLGQMEYTVCNPSSIFWVCHMVSFQFHMPKTEERHPGGVLITCPNHPSCLLWKRRTTMSSLPDVHVAHPVLTPYSNYNQWCCPFILGTLFFLYYWIPVCLHTVPVSSVYSSETSTLPYSLKLLHNFAGWLHSVQACPTLSEHITTCCHNKSDRNCIIAEERPVTTQSN